MSKLSQTGGKNLGFWGISSRLNVDQAASAMPSAFGTKQKLATSALPAKGTLLDRRLLQDTERKPPTLLTWSAHDPKRTFIRDQETPRRQWRATRRKSRTSQANEGTRRPSLGARAPQARTPIGRRRKRRRFVVRPNDRRTSRAPDDHSRQTNHAHERFLMSNKSWMLAAES